MGFEEKLIEIIKENEILYNKKSGGYKNSAKKAELWENISQKLGQPVAECMSKWKSLRDRFAKLSKEKRSQPSGSGTTLKAEWEYYQNLTFLHDHIQPRKTVSNYHPEVASRSSTPLICESAQSSSSINMEIPSTFMSESFSFIEEGPIDSLDSSVTPKKATKRKAAELHNEMGSNIASTMTALQQYLNRGTTSNSNFAQSVDVLVNSLNTENKSKAEAKIMEYLCKCQLENLKNGDVANVQM